MADFAPVLHRAIFALPQNSGEARQQIYDCARFALRTLLEASEEADKGALENERLALETVILRRKIGVQWTRNYQESPIIRRHGKAAAPEL